MKPAEFHFADRPEHKGMPCFTSAAFKGKLLQWGIETSLKRKCMRFTGHFDEKADPAPFLRQLFSLPTLREAMKFRLEEGGVKSVEFERLKLSVLSMSFFDRLVDAGYVKVAPEEDINGLLVSDDLLTDALGNPSSKNVNLYPDNEKQELIYKIFHLLVLGRTMRQPDTEFSSYIEATKALYKDMVKVYKKANNSDKIEFASLAFQVKSLNKSKEALFGEGSSESSMNCCLVAVDPWRGHVSIISKLMIPFW